MLPEAAPIDDATEPILVDQRRGGEYDLGPLLAACAPAARPKGGEDDLGPRPARRASAMNPPEPGVGDADLRLSVAAAAFPLGDAQGGIQCSSSSSSTSASESDETLKQIPSGEPSTGRDGPAPGEGEKGAASGLS